MSIQIFCSVFNIHLLLSSCKSSLCILNTSLSSDIWFAKVFSRSVGCLFTFLIVSLEAFFFPFHFSFFHQFLFFILMMSSESVFPFVTCGFRVTARKPLPNQMAQRFMLMFPSRQRKRKWQPTPVLLPAKFHGWRSLMGCSPWGDKESDMTEQLHFPSRIFIVFSSVQSLSRVRLFETPWIAVLAPTFRSLIILS